MMPTENRIDYEFLVEEKSENRRKSRKKLMKKARHSLEGAVEDQMVRWCKCQKLGAIC